MTTPEELLFDLVSIKSFSGDESRASMDLKRALPSLVWEKTFIDDIGNVVATKGNGSKELILMGHIDTVPGGPSPLLSGGILHGRGSVDAKGPLCAFAVSGGVSEVPPGFKLTLIAAVGEEKDSRGARYRLFRHNPSACIIGEPSGTNGVTIGYRGCMHIRFSGEDSGFHRSSDQGPLTSCLMAAASVIKHVEKIDDPEKKIIERPHAAVVSMLGTENGARKAEVVLDLRIPVGMEIQDFTLLAQKTADKRHVELSIEFTAPPLMVPRNDPVVRSLRNAIRKCDLKPVMYAKGGTADFNLASQWNCPLAAYGPGDSRLDHTSGEKINLNDYLLAIDVLKIAIPSVMQNFADK